MLRGKVAKLEEETSSLKEQNALLTAKTEDLEVHLQEERENSAQVSLNFLGLTFDSCENFFSK